MWIPAACLALLPEQQPLMHTKTMLLVDDGESESRERHLLLEESVGANRDADLARGEASKDLGALAHSQASGQQRQ